MNKIALSVAAALTTLSGSAIAAEFEFGKIDVHANLRYEGVQQDNALDDAKALTLRTRIGYTSPMVNGFSLAVSGEDVRALVEDYNAAGLNGEAGYSIVADPEVTEVDLALLAYKGKGVSITLGRQIIAWDGQRFVGHVGWRQDRQTFDAVSLSYTGVKDLTAKYAYIDKRNRIFAQNRDVDSADHLFNVAYKASVGTVTGYVYLLDDKDSDTQIDTFGVSFAGAKELDGFKLLYTAELATQDKDDYSATYTLLEAGAAVSGITYKLGYEVLGSDDGMYGFTTPLATGHKFNGWADQFLGTPSSGLKDIYVSATGKAMGGKWVAAYHDFSADTGSASYGSEIDLLYARSINKNLSTGVKFAKYSADGFKVDTDKVWLWLTATY